jgi:hypothetical protein
MPQQLVTATTAGWVRALLAVLGITVGATREWVVKFLRWVFTGHRTKPRATAEA